MKLSKHLIILIAFLLISSCSEKPLDNSLWQTICDDLDNGTYKACYGPGWEIGSVENKKHYDFYQISVEKVLENNNRRVLFEQKFNANVAPQEFLNWNKNNIVQYAESAKKVSFHINDKLIEFTINE